MKKLLSILLLFLLLAGSAYWYWTGTPQYSLAELADSVRRHDLERFKVYFDTEKVARHAVDDLLSEELKRLGGTGLLQRLLGIGIAGLFKPQLSSLLAKQIETYVAGPGQNRKEEKQAEPEHPDALHEDKQLSGFKKTAKGLVNQVLDAIKPPSLRDVLRELGLSKENYRGLTSFDQRDSSCYVGLKFQAAGKDEITVYLELEHTGQRHWQVVRFSNLDRISRSLAGI